MIIGTPLYHGSMDAGSDFLEALFNSVWSGARFVPLYSHSRVPPLLRPLDSASAKFGLYMRPVK